MFSRDKLKKFNCKKENVAKNADGARKHAVAFPHLFIMNVFAVFYKFTNNKPNHADKNLSFLNLFHFTIILVKMQEKCE